ncbi:MAG: hypothetical protein U1E65_07270 [Myxococcota bacterium]
MGTTPRAGAWVTALLAALLPAGPLLAAPRDRWTIDVSTDRQLEVLTATTCVEGKKPDRLMPMMRGARPFLLRARAVEGRRALAIVDGSFAFPPKGACFAVDIGLGALVDEGRDRELGVRVEGALLLAPDAWLWLSRPEPDEAELRVRFHLPSGLAVATPWPESEGDFTVPRSAFDWQGMMVLGRFDRTRLSLPGTAIDLVRLGDLSADRASLSRWAEGAAGAVSTVLGHFPDPRLLVIVEPVPGFSGDPIVFGEALRGGGSIVHALASRRAEGSSFFGEWVLVHEMSHFLLPFVAEEGTWLSEGVATYYQNVLRARAGMLSEEEAIQRLEEGFQRGRDNAVSDPMKLERASAEMHQRGAYMRVYWTGAAIAMAADVELRVSRRGSLDAAVAATQELRRSARERVPLLEVLRTMDGASKTEVFRRAAQAAMGNAAFPSLQDAYQKLGIRVEGGRVKLSDTPEAVALRREIFGAPQSRSR